MELIQEYGAGVRGANTYVTTDELKRYASTNNLVYEGDEEGWLLEAMLYIEQLSFKGDKKSELQRLEWPRLNVKVNRKELSDATIPQDLKDLQCEVAIEIANGNNPLGDGRSHMDEFDARPFSNNRKIKLIEARLTRVSGGLVVCLFRGW